ncbi:ROK family protein [Candidatus Soleaferrea massiliensis]|uniref:ROK family protein n=1 Tax=Candidatus Soleaferrea massiliensis TaxID=1470354 RepID=UPI00058F19B1|nr:ROK family protein [Candidatus Soleaferrea massiliensis]
MKYYVGIDLGGTNIAVGVVNEEYEIVGRGKLKTNVPRPAEEIVDDMVKATHLALENAGVTMDQIEWIGIGSPGIANKATGVLEFSGNLDFYNVPLVGMMEDRVHKKVYLENDANAAAYAEILAGSAKGCRDAIVITLGTGVGSGIIIDGKIYSGFNYAGAELGHMGIVYGGRDCTCGRKGCFEAYCSATGLINITKDHMKKNPDSKLWELAEGDIEKVNGRIPYDGMRLGDKAATEAVDEYVNYMAYGLASCINIFQPEILCIGGGISKEGETLLAPLREKIAKEDFNKDPNKRTKLVAAKLGNDAGIIGSAFLGNLA